MFRIEAAGSRLIATSTLTRDDFAVIAERLGASPFRARKSGFIAASAATSARKVETRWNGRETASDAAPGDMIATNMGADRSVLRDGDGNVNVYVIKASRFADLYERDTGTIEHGDIYRPRGVVSALYLPAGFEILAPWGETQRAATGYLLDNGAEVYGNAKETFEATYVRL